MIESIIIIGLAIFSGIYIVKKIRNSIKYVDYTKCGSCPSITKNDNNECNCCSKK